LSVLFTLLNPGRRAPTMVFSRLFRLAIVLFVFRFTASDFLHGITNFSQGSGVVDHVIFIL